MMDAEMRDRVLKESIFDNSGSTGKGAMEQIVRDRYVKYIRHAISQGKSAEDIALEVYDYIEPEDIRDIIEIVGIYKEEVEKLESVELGC